MIWDRDIIARLRDYADLRFSEVITADDRTWWLQLREVAEEMLAGERDEGELADWLSQYELTADEIRNFECKEAS